MDYLIPGVKGSQTQNIFQTFVKMGGLGVILGKVSVNHCASHSGNQPLHHCCSAESLADLKTASCHLKIVLILTWNEDLAAPYTSTFLHNALWCRNDISPIPLVWANMKKRRKSTHTLASFCDFVRKCLVFFSKCSDFLKWKLKLRSLLLRTVAVKSRER